MKFALMYLSLLLGDSWLAEWASLPIATPLEPLVTVELIVVDYVPSAIVIGTPVGEGFMAWTDPPSPRPPKRAPR